MNRQTLYIRALAGRAEVFHVVGVLKKSMADFESTVKLSRDSYCKRDALVGLSGLYSELGDYDRELACANRLIKITRNKDLFSRGKALIIKAGALRDKGDYELSLKTSEKSINLYRLAQQDARFSRKDQQRIQGNISSAYNTMGMVYNLQGKYDSALAFFKKTLNIVKKINNQIAIAQSLNNIGLICWHNTKFEKARDYFNKSLEIAEKIGYKNAISTILGNMGIIYNDLAKPHIALGYLQKAIKISEEIGTKVSTANNLTNAGLCYAHVYDFNNAIKYYTQSLNIFQKIGNKFGTAMTLNNIGMIYCEKGDYKKAFTYANEAENIALSADISEVIIRCGTLKARIFGVFKKYAESIELLKKSIESAEKSKMEDLRIEAVIQYVKTAIEEKNKTYLGDIAKYITLLENVYKNVITKKNKCALLVILIKYGLFEKKYEDARKKLAELLSIVKKSGDKKLLIETFLIHAQLNRVTGKKYIQHIMKAKELAKEIGLNPILNEIKKIIKEK